MNDKALYFVLGVATAVAVGVYIKRRGAGCGCHGAEHTYPEDEPFAGDDEVGPEVGGVFSPTGLSISDILTAPAALVA